MSAIIIMLWCQACAPEQEVIEPFDMAAHSRTLTVNDLEFPVATYGEGPAVEICGLIDFFDGFR